MKGENIVIGIYSSDSSSMNWEEDPLSSGSLSELDSMYSFDFFAA